MLDLNHKDLILEDKLYFIYSDNIKKIKRKLSNYKHKQNLILKKFNGKIY